AGMCHTPPRRGRVWRKFRGAGLTSRGMDSLVASAARSLAAGDPLGALKRVALRDDPPALALRGIAMAQLGEYERARKLLRRAARGFGPREPLERARCQAAEAEVVLAGRDLRSPERAVVAGCPADPRRIGEAGDARRSGGALRLRRSDRRRLPACRAWAGQLPLAREPPGALRDHPRARGGLARRCSPRGADRPRVRSAIAERVTPRTAARRGRARAGRHPIVRGCGRDQGGVRARTSRGASGGGARAADRRTRWVDPGAARGG